MEQANHLQQTHVGFLSIDPQFGFNNTQVEISMSPLSLLIGFVLGFIACRTLRG
ncbi:MAG: hypothetical protein AAFX01_14355 [Cyanobacteria bacterium J06638_28]